VQARKVSGELASQFGGASAETTLLVIIDGGRVRNSGRLALLTTLWLLLLKTWFPGSCLELYRVVELKLITSPGANGDKREPLQRLLEHSRSLCRTLRSKMRSAEILRQVLLGNPWVAVVGTNSPQVKPTVRAGLGI
jgi:hypothetical protein